jgi:methyl acetate hydrolase
LFPGQDVKWGLSFLINPQQGPAGRSGGSLTWAGLANTYFWVDPSKRVAGVILRGSCCHEALRPVRERRI